MTTLHVMKWHYQATVLSVQRRIDSVNATT
jgi:hypothetical protein